MIKAAGRGIGALLILAAVTVLWGGAAEAGSLAMHSSVGDVLGQGAASDRDAFLLGLTSHAVLDTWLRQKVFNWQEEEDIRMHRWHIAADLLLSAAVMWRIAQDNYPVRRRRRTIALAGSLLPDVIDGLYALKCPECWMRGDLLIPWHDAHRVQMDEDRTVTWAIALVVLTWK